MSERACPACIAERSAGDEFCDNHRNPHRECRHANKELRREIGRVTRDALACHAANQRIARAVRAMALPGIKRKTIRLDELRELIDRADGALEQKGGDATNE